MFSNLKLIDFQQNCYLKQDKKFKDFNSKRFSLQPDTKYLAKWWSSFVELHLYDAINYVFFSSPNHVLSESHSEIVWKSAGALFLWWSYLYHVTQWMYISQAHASNKAMEATIGKSSTKQIFWVVFLPENFRYSGNYNLSCKKEIFFRKCRNSSKIRFSN